MLETSFGPVVIHGNLAGFRSERPLLFMIRGAFPEADMLVRLGETFPEADFAWADLPGMHSPHFAWPSLPLFAAAFDEAIDLLFAARRVTVLGISMGGTTALHLRSPSVRAIVAADPLLQTAPAWPLQPWARANIAQQPAHGEWTWNVLGIGPTRVENRDYRGALDGVVADTRILVGGEPLGDERAITRLPGLICDEDRRTLVHRLGQERVTILPNVGHHIPRDAEVPFVQAIQAVLR